MATFTVTNLNDSGAGSLRAAVALANANADADTIVFQAGLTGTISLLSQLTLSQDVTIDGDTNGDDRADVVLSGRDANGILGISGSTTDVDLFSLTLRDGKGFVGSAVYFDGGTLDIADSTITANYSQFGGAILQAGSGSTLTITDSLLSDNSTKTTGYTVGGALYLGGTATITNTTLTGNHAAQGGAIFANNIFANVTLINSTVTDNHATRNATDGGGIHNFGGKLYIVNSVVADNTAGAAYTRNDISSDQQQVQSASHSVFSTTPTLTSNTANQFNVTSVGLGALGDHGGTVQTREILPDSVLINAGGTTSLTTDADGNDRVVAGTVDIGATEFQLVVTTLDDVVDANDGELSLREALSLANGNADADTIVFADNLTGVLRLASELVIATDLSIDGDTNGDGKADITISGDTDSDDSGDVRIFNIDGGTEVTLKSLTLSDGYVDAVGGAIAAATGSSLLLIGMTIRDSRATSSGGGIRSDGQLIAVNTTLYNNSADVYGGGIFISSNGAATLLNTTLTANYATQSGGGISTNTGASIKLYLTTITANRTGGYGAGIDLFGASLESVNSIIAGNVASNRDNDVSFANSSTFEGDYNFLGMDVVLTTDGGHNKRGNDPLLGTLADNGGPVKTMAPRDGSPVIGAGNSADVAIGQDDIFDLDGDSNTSEPTPIDARGGQRAVGTIDIGAVELQTRNDARSIAEVNTDTVTSVFGNVVTNDAAGSFVTGARTGAESTGATVTSFSSQKTLTGTYGQLIIHTDGSYQYNLIEADPQTNALAAGQVVHELFTYKINANGLVDTAQLDIAITGANDAPVLTGFGNVEQFVFEIPENTTALTTVNATDVDAGATRSYSISGLDAAFFTINSATGVLSFLNAPDAEALKGSAGGIYLLAVTVTDNGGLTDTQELAVIIDNVAGIAIKGHKTKADTIDTSHGPKGKFATGEEDTINGHGGNDTIKGGGGNDTIKGGLGKDSIDGGKGSDTVDFSDKTVSVELTLNGKKAVKAMIGGSAEDTVRNVESVISGKSSDTLTGDKKANVLTGNAGNDKLDGGKGSDSMDGGQGNDTLIGGSGANLLTGGEGKDTFVFNAKGPGSTGTFMDFKHNTDLIGLDAAVFGTIGQSLDKTEFYAKAGAVAAHDLDDRIIYNRTTGALYYDADGNKAGGTDSVLIAAFYFDVKAPKLDHEDFVIV